MRMAMVILALVLASPAAGEIVEGSVRFDGGPLPGCTITLTSPLRTYTAVSDEKGEFRFADVRAGRYEMRYELPGLEPVQQPVDVWRTTIVPAQEMEPFSVVCTITLCSEVPPATIFDAPLCADVALHTTLIESLEGGDRSALALIRQRYETADSYHEQHRLAGVLLEHLPEETAIRNELVKRATPALRSSDLFFKVRSMAVSALYTLAEDPRAGALLDEALQSSDAEVVGAAVFGLAWHRRTAALPAIAAALERIGVPEAAQAAFALALFGSEEADTLAFKYIAEDERETYFEARKRE
jgi:hypothetical protein